MQDRRDGGQVNCRAGGMQDRRMQDKRDGRQVGHGWKDAGAGQRYARQVGCKAEGM